MASWSPVHAMKAYMHSLQLCKDFNNEAKLIDPECMEYLSALAAGNRASLMVDAEAGGASSCTVALAVAAKHTGGRLICVRGERAAMEETKRQLENLGLGEVAEYEFGKPLEVVEQLRGVCLAVVDHELEDCTEILQRLDMNPNGSVVVVSNLFHGGGGGGGGQGYSQIVGRGGRSGGHYSRSVLLPFGEGMEVTKIGKICSSSSSSSNNNNSSSSSIRVNHPKRSRRMFLVYEQ